MERHTATVTLRSIAPYSQSRQHNTDKLDKETADAYETRTWREKAHFTPEGNVLIPPMAFKKCVEAGAKFIGRQIPGKGKATYTKHFKSGIIVAEPLVLDVTRDTLESETVSCDADGKKDSTGGKRVPRTFPVLHSWEGDVRFEVIDPTITEDVFKETVEESGMFIGIGRFRPENGGYYGRFEVAGLKWE